MIIKIKQRTKLLVKRTPLKKDWEVCSCHDIARLSKVIKLKESGISKNCSCDASIFSPQGSE